MHPASQAYVNGETQAEIRKNLNLSEKKLRKILLDDNIKIRPRGGDRTRKHFFRENAFDVHSQESAYWCGFLMADGCLSNTPDSHHLSLSIGVEDRLQIERYAEHLGLDRSSIKDNVRPDSAQLSVTICAKSLPRLLRPWGIVQCKTRNFSEPSVSRDVLPAYLRGWADGDGYVRLRKSKEAFRVTGNPLAVRWYAGALRRLGFDGRIGFEDGARGTWSKCVISGRLNLLRVYRLLEASSPLRLERKWAPLDSQVSEVASCR